MGKVTAIVLAAGVGKRMNSGVAKQYMQLLGNPVLYYSLKAFEESMVDEVILVVGVSEIEEVTNQIVNHYGFRKVRAVVAGGNERYLSVKCGLEHTEDTDYVLIHDGARPLITTKVINTVIEEVKVHKACVVGVLSKDTVKISDEEQNVGTTPKRNHVWLIQTPQAFAYPIIIEAYASLMKEEEISVTDDSMVVERLMKYKVHLVQGDYENIKITGAEDIRIAEVLLPTLK